MDEVKVTSLKRQLQSVGWAIYAVKLDTLDLAADIAGLAHRLDRIEEAAGPPRLNLARDGASVIQAEEEK